MLLKDNLEGRVRIRKICKDFVVKSLKFKLHVGVTSLSLLHLTTLFKKKVQ